MNLFFKPILTYSQVQTNPSFLIGRLLKIHEEAIMTGCDIIKVQYFL